MLYVYVAMLGAFASIVLAWPGLALIACTLAVATGIAGALDHGSLVQASLQVVTILCVLETAYLVSGFAWNDAFLDQPR